jgi:hypothetical protein
MTNPNPPQLEKLIQKNFFQFPRSHRMPHVMSDEKNVMHSTTTLTAPNARKRG